MKTDDVQWLVEEMMELLDVGEAGVYELVEALRQRYPDADAIALRPIAHAALTELLRDESIKLAWYEWPKSDAVAPADMADVRPETFDSIGAQRYLGLERR